MTIELEQTKVLVSACLLGQRVRYDGGHSESGAKILAQWRAEGRVVAFCPEVAGGLGTPRPPAQIVEANGDDVLDGKARILDENGDDVSAAFLAGAQATLEVAQEAGISIAILKSKSPSCGSQRIYNTLSQADGSTTSALVPGMGITTALLRRHGIEVFNEHQFDQALAYLQALRPNP